jgi:hypothetical protein
VIHGSAQVDRWKQVSIGCTFSSSRQELHGKQARVWTRAVQDLGLDLDPYDCKAAYLCGMLRQFIEAAGLQLASEYHVGTLVSAASAAELLGWCYKNDPDNRLEDGVAYLQTSARPTLGQSITARANWWPGSAIFGTSGRMEGPRASG